jgi:ubiquinone/menaquinone biosynthesis C-methylase UbiE
MAFTNPDSNIEQINLHEGDHVVVFGSGGGGHSFAAARALRGTGQVIALDVRPDLLEKLRSESMRSHLTNVRPVLGNPENSKGSKQPDSTTDVVIIPNTLFAYDDKEAIFSEAHRILKPDGRLVIIDWRSSFAGMGPSEKDVLPASSAKRLALDATFTFVQNISAGDHHYGMVFKK